MPPMVGRRVAGGVAAWVVTAAVLRVAAVPPADCPDVTRAGARAAAREAVGWLTRNQLDDGRWVYGYDRVADREAPDYNIVRHAGVTMSLYQAAVAGDDDALAAADRGLGWAIDHLVRRDGWAALANTGEHPKLGSTALLVSALTIRRELGDTSHDGLLGELGRFMLVQQRPDGSMLAAWDPTTGAPVPDETSSYFTGEAYWALARLNAAFPGRGWEEPARRLSYYLATERDEVEGLGPLFNDHWAAYGLDAVAAWPGGTRLDDDEIAYARHLGAAFGLRIRMESQQRASGIVRFVRGKQLLGAGLGTLGEGLAGVHRVAQRDDRLADLRPALTERLRCIAGLLADRQVTAEEAARDPRPGLTRGAWFHDGRTQMDDQQHSLSALLLADPVLR